MTSKRILLSIFFLCLWLTTAHSADPVYPDHPKDIRLTGALLAPSAKEQEDIVTINIFLGDAPSSHCQKDGQNDWKFFWQKRHSGCEASKQALWPVPSCDAIREGDDERKSETDKA